MPTSQSFARAGAMKLIARDSARSRISAGHEGRPWDLTQTRLLPPSRSVTLCSTSSRSSHRSSMKV